MKRRNVIAFSVGLLLLGSTIGLWMAHRGGGGPAGTAVGPTAPEQASHTRPMVTVPGSRPRLSLPALPGNLPGSSRRSGAELVSEAPLRALGPDRFVRVRVFRTDYKFPLLRVEETIVRDPDNDTFRVRHFREVIADHIIVALAEDAIEEDLHELNDEHGGVILRKMTGRRLYLVGFAEAEPDTVPARIADYVAHPDVVPLMILLTDGAGNVSMTNIPPQEEAHRVADQINESDIRNVTINMEHSAFDQGLADGLAKHLGGPCLTLSELKAAALYEAVKAELE